MTILELLDKLIYSDIALVEYESTGDVCGNLLAVAFLDHITRAIKKHVLVSPQLTLRRVDNYDNPHELRYGDAVIYFHKNGKTIYSYNSFFTADISKLSLIKDFKRYEKF